MTINEIITEYEGKLQVMRGRSAYYADTGDVKSCHFARGMQRQLEDDIIVLYDLKEQIRKLKDLAGIF